jgi:hypothetical protein
MKSGTILKVIGVLALVALALPVFLADSPAAARPPLDATTVGDDFRDVKYLNKNSCPDDPKNLAINGGVFPDTHDTAYGPVVTPWEPFIFSGPAPQFRWVNNEGIFKGQSEQILSTNTFDAGIYQVVHNVQPGTYYWFRLGWTPAAKSYEGQGSNVESMDVGRKLGYDPFGGTDPKSPNVVWGPELWGDTKGLNRPQMILVFPARAANITVFIRVMARNGSGGENRVWLNAVCMEARPEVPAATPIAPTATPPPSAPPTRPPSQTRPPATRIAQVAQSPVATNTQAVATATTTSSPTAPSSPTVSATPRYARPEVTPAPSLPVNPSTGAATGLGVMFVMTGFVSLGIGVVLLIKQSRPARRFAPDQGNLTSWE